MFNLTKEEFRAKWIEALKSGRFKKGKDRLCTIENNDIIRHCCLGVACEIFKENGGELESKEFLEDFYEYRAYNGIKHYLPNIVREALGLYAEDGLINDNPHYSLAYVNDHVDSFIPIIELLENPPKGLYKEESDAT